METGYRTKSAQATCAEFAIHKGDFHPLDVNNLPARKLLVGLGVLSMNKISHRVAEIWIAHSFAPTFEIITNGSDGDHVLAGVPGGDAVPFETLIQCLEPPYLLLYVLHTPRGEGAPGRYQSPPLSFGQVRGFVSQYGAFFSVDSRFDLWAHSPSSRATVVWDRHNQLFGYGPVDSFLRALRSIGFTPGEVSLQFPHVHHYRQEFDDDAAKVMDAFQWSYSPLRPEDEQ